MLILCQPRLHFRMLSRMLSLQRFAVQDSLALLAGSGLSTSILSRLYNMGLYRLIKRLQGIGLRFSCEEFSRAIGKGVMFVLASILLNLVSSNVAIDEAKQISVLRLCLVYIPLSFVHYLPLTLTTVIACFVGHKCFLYFKSTEVLPVVAPSSPSQATGFTHPQATRPLDTQGMEPPQPQSTTTPDLQGTVHRHNPGIRQSSPQATGNAESQGTGPPNLQGEGAPQHNSSGNLDTPLATEPPHLQATEPSPTSIGPGFEDDTLELLTLALISHSATESASWAAESSGNVALTIRFKRHVRKVEVVFKPHTTLSGSKILHKRIEIGPETGTSELEELKKQLLESMRRAQELDPDCTLQFGSFAVLKYTDSGHLKWWRLQNHWTPIVFNITRSHKISLLDLLRDSPDSHNTWMVSGFNLHTATLKASTNDKSEILKVLKHQKIENGEDLFTCEEPGLVRSAASMFWKKVYICASNSVEVETGVKVDLQSKPKFVDTQYVIPGMKSFIPSLWTAVISLSFVLIQTLLEQNPVLRRLCQLSLFCSLIILATIRPFPKVLSAIRFPKMLLTPHDRLPGLGSDGRPPTVEDISESPSPATRPSFLEGEDVLIPQTTPASEDLTNIPLPPTEEEWTKMDVNIEEQEENEEEALVGLVNCLSQNDHGGFQEKAAWELADLASSRNNALKLRVADAEGALVGLVNCLSHSDHLGLQEQAARALANIACSADNALKFKVADAEGALVGLVNCLSHNDHRGLQEAAAGVLANISGSTDDALKLRVADAEGALVGLVNCLSHNDHRGLQEAAAGVLVNISGSTDDALKLRVADAEGALVGLVNCLSHNDHRGLQEAAAGVLANISGSTANALKLRVANAEGALVGLINCLSHNDHSGLQEAAAGVLANIASSTDNALKLKVADVEGALVGLVNCLSQNDHRGLQEAAAWVLANISDSTDNALKLRVADVEGALVGLVNCLSQNDHRGLQEAATWALANIVCSTDNALKLKVANAEGALVGLVNCLSHNDHRGLQEQVAGVLANIAGSMNNALKLRVADVEGALVGLVNCLSQNDHRCLQEAAAWVLANIAGSTDDALKLRVTNVEGALVGLVNCLSQNDHHGLQEAATLVLANIAGSTDNALKLRVANVEGALVGLVKCLSMNDHRGLQEEAAWALANLAGSRDNSLKLRVANAEGALVGLVKCLSKKDHRSLQEAAARALANLVCSRDNTLKLRVANEEGFLVALVNCLLQNDNLYLEREAARMASNLAGASEAKVMLKKTQGLLEGLTSLVRDDMRSDTRYAAVEALLKIDPTLARTVGLLSVQFDANPLSKRISVKGELGDFQRALDDANEPFNWTDADRAFGLQERRVLN